MAFHLKSINVVKAKNSSESCAYCNYPAEYNCYSDSSYKISACYCCAANFMLYSMKDGDMVSFFPDIPIDIISHMQRAIAVALKSPEKRETAKKLQKWLFAHAKFVEDSQWKTSSPQAFDNVLARLSEDQQVSFFSELYVILSEESLSVSGELSSWEEFYPKPKFWNEHYQETQKLSFEGK